MSGWLPPNGALHGWALDRLLHWDFAAMAALFVLAHIVLLIAVLRRHKSGTRDLSSHGPVAWIALACVCGLYVWMALSAQRLWAAARYEGSAPGALQVEVTGVQFQWYFRYPGPDGRFGRTDAAMVNAPAGNPLGIDPRDTAGRDDVVSSILVLPAGREVDLRLRAQDVIHGFFVPGMRLKQDAVPGLELHVHFTPQIAGMYPVLCSQVCGLGHYRMQTRLLVVSPAEFTKWLALREKSGAAS